MTISPTAVAVNPRKTIHLYDIKQLKEVNRDAYTRAMDDERERRQFEWLASERHKVMRRALQTLGEKDLEVDFGESDSRIRIVGYMSIPQGVKIKADAGKKYQLLAIRVRDDFNFVGWERYIHDDGEILSNAEGRKLAECKKTLEDQLWTIWYEKWLSWQSDSETLKSSIRRKALYYEDGTEFPSVVA